MRFSRMIVTSASLDRLQLSIQPKSTESKTFLAVVTESSVSWSVRMAAVAMAIIYSVAEESAIPVVSVLTNTFGRTSSLLTEMVCSRILFMRPIRSR